MTGPDFSRGVLRFDAPDAAIEVRGTTLAVICEPDATCLCVLDGTAAMIDREGRVESVAPGTRRTVYRDGRAPLVEAIRPMEQMKLDMLANQGDSLLLRMPD